MTRRRLNPRHCTQNVTVATYAAVDDVYGTWGEPVAVKRVQVKHSREILTVAGESRVVSLMTVRIPPRDTTPPLEDLFAPDSQVTHRGRSSYVLTCETVFTGPGPAFVRVTAGDRRPAHGGIQVTVELIRTGGRDPRGNPLPSQPPVTIQAIVIPGDTSEPTDLDDSTVTKAELLVDGDLLVTSTDQFRFTLPAALAGMWGVDGDPSPSGARLKVPLRKQP